VSSRLHLTKPIDGWFGDFLVTLIEVNTGGATALHGDVIPDGARALLRFPWRGVELEVTAEISGGSDGRSTLRFVEDSAELREAVDASGDELLRAQEANLRGEREKNVIGEETLTSASLGARAFRGYIVFRLTPEGWKQTRSLLSEQPEDGFTVSEDEPQEQIDILCRTYESGDAETQKMMRSIAELSTRR
jgi:hypothetical protein